MGTKFIIPRYVKVYIFMVNFLGGKGGGSNINNLLHIFDQPANYIIDSNEIVDQRNRGLYTEFSIPNFHIIDIVITNM